MEKVVDKYNVIVGTVVALCTALFGAYWYIFVGYLICNVIDWLTGWYKAKKTGIESSKVGLIGIVKKVGYWAIILVAFLIPETFIALGNDLLGIKLDFLTFLGWFTLASLLVNEIRSILENLVECGYHVPEFLIKGLAVMHRVINAKANGEIPDIEQDNNRGA